MVNNKKNKKMKFLKFFLPMILSSCMVRNKTNTSTVIEHDGCLYSVDIENGYVHIDDCENKFCEFKNNEIRKDKEVFSVR